MERMKSMGREERIGRGKWRLTSRCLCGAIEPRTSGRRAQLCPQTNQHGSQMRTLPSTTLACLQDRTGVWKDGKARGWLEHAVRFVSVRGRTWCSGKASWKQWQHQTRNTLQCDTRPTRDVTCSVAFDEDLASLEDTVLLSF